MARLAGGGAALDGTVLQVRIKDDDLYASSAGRPSAVVVNCRSRESGRGAAVLEVAAAMGPMRASGLAQANPGVP